MPRSRVTPVAIAVVLGALILSPKTQATTVNSKPPKAVSGPVLLAATQATPVSAEKLVSFISEQINQVGSPDLVSALIVDDSTGAILFSQAANRPMIPASTLKLLTSIGVLRQLGLETRFETNVVQDGATLTLVGGGDPTLVSATPANWRGKPPGVEQPPSLDQLADLVAAKLVGSSGPFVINIDSSYFASAAKAQSWPKSFVSQGFVSPVTGLTVDFGVDENEHAYKNPTLFAGDYLAKALTARGFESALGKDVAANPSATQIASVQSARVMDIVERMVTTSNNTMAEYLSHQVGKKNSDDSFENSAKLIQQEISGAGIDAAGLEIFDGSGLSSKNKVTAQTLISALRSSHANESLSWPLLSGLPIAGVSGTLEERFAAADSGRGFVRAKTGTLSGVVSLAGTLTTASGNVLDFAILANGISSTTDTQKDVDSVIKRIAECGCS